MRGEAGWKSLKSLMGAAFRTIWSPTTVGGRGAKIAAYVYGDRQRGKCHDDVIYLEQF